MNRPPLSEIISKADCSSVLSLRKSLLKYFSDLPVVYGLGVYDWFRSNYRYYDPNYGFSSCSCHYCLKCSRKGSPDWFLVEFKFYYATLSQPEADCFSLDINVVARNYDSLL